MVKLKHHILRRMRQGLDRLDDDTIYSAEERSKLHIRGNRFFEHKSIRINYTTYDVRRDYDSITQLHPDIMLLSNEDISEGSGAPIHPFWYARVLKIFHVFVSDMGSGRDKLERMDILWVRWFGLDAD
jgi:hypothetical protein